MLIRKKNVCLKFLWEMAQWFEKKTKFLLETERKMSLSKELQLPFRKKKVFVISIYIL